MDVATLALVHQLYGAQSHFIDNGDAAAWADTFTPDGEFRSPSYPAPVTGTATCGSSPRTSRGRTASPVT